MDFRLTEEQEMMKRICTILPPMKLHPFASEWDHNHIYPQECLNKMHELGFMAIGAPAEYGGPGLDHVVTQNIAAEEIRAAMGAQALSWWPVPYWLLILHM